VFLGNPGQAVHDVARVCDAPLEVKVSIACETAKRNNNRQNQNDGKHASRYHKVARRHRHIRLTVVVD
jgi:hypothetical protein